MAVTAGKEEGCLLICITIGSCVSAPRFYMVISDMNSPLEIQVVDWKAQYERVLE